MPTDLTALVPTTKFETERASALVEVGFPAVEKVMPQILEWLQDVNWPVGRVFQPFLVSIGRPLAPHIRVVLTGQDDGWKYSLLMAVVAQSSELAHALRPELERIASNPSPSESKEEVDQVALEILEALDGGASEA
jgi:hypothetical protein